jgi:arylsulfatase A-like enzyme
MKEWSSRRRVCGCPPGLAAAVVLFFIGSAGCHGREASPPNVLVIVVDTLRADRLGAYGDRRGLTPFLDQLAESGAVFTSAYAASSWTVPSVASLFTSRYPAQHQVVAFGSHVPEEEVTIAERLAGAGYVGGGFSANFRLLERLGFAQGFAYWRADVKMPGGLDAATLSAQGLEWLDRTWQRGARKPAMLFFQFMEPHSPYEPTEQYLARVVPPGTKSRTKVEQVEALRARVLAGEEFGEEDVRDFRDCYDAEVAQVDDRIRDLFAALRERGFLDRAIVFVLSDHGEEFEEHGHMEHGKSLFEEVVRVPLIVVGPRVAAGLRVEENVSLVDVGPTLLDLLGLPAEPRFEGRSLVPLMRGSATGAGPDILMELEFPGLGRDQRVHHEAIVRDKAKVVVALDGTPTGYDLAADPGEHEPNPAAVGAEVPKLTAALHERLVVLRKRRSSATEVEDLDEGAKEKLRALGYLQD